MFNFIIQYNILNNIILFYIFSLKQDFRNFEEHNLIKIRLIINE